MQNIDIRIGLVGLRESGKSIMIGVLPKVFWGARQMTQIEPADTSTADYLRSFWSVLRGQSTVVVPNPQGSRQLYSLTYRRTPRFLDIGGFEYNMQILDVDGEAFVRSNDDIYGEWLSRCNAVIFLINGDLLAGTGKSKADTQIALEHQYLFEYIRDRLIIELRRMNLQRQSRMFLGFAVSKYDQFEKNGNLSPAQLVKDRAAPVYEIIDRLCRTERKWASVRWYGISALGYVWDAQGKEYARSKEVDPKASPLRIPQCYLDEQNGKNVVRIRRAGIIRPEGMQQLFNDIRRHLARYPFYLPALDSGEVAAEAFQGTRLRSVLPTAPAVQEAVDLSEVFADFDDPDVPPPAPRDSSDADQLSRLD